MPSCSTNWASGNRSRVTKLAEMLMRPSSKNDVHSTPGWLITGFVVSLVLWVAWSATMFWLSLAAGCEAMQKWIAIQIEKGFWEGLEIQGVRGGIEMHLKAGNFQAAYDLTTEDFR